MIPEQLNVLLPKVAGDNLFVGNIADLHVVLHRHNILSVQSSTTLHRDLGTTFSEYLQPNEVMLLLISAQNFE